MTKGERLMSPNVTLLFLARISSFCLTFASVERSTAVKSKKSVAVQQPKSFEGSRKDMNAAIDRICEFMGKLSYDLMKYCVGGVLTFVSFVFYGSRNEDCILGHETDVHRKPLHEWRFPV